MTTGNFYCIALCVLTFGAAPVGAAHLNDYNDFAVCSLDALHRLKGCLVELGQTQQEHRARSLAALPQGIVEREQRACYRQYEEAQQGCISHCPRSGCPMPAD